MRLREDLDILPVTAIEFFERIATAIGCGVPVSEIRRSGTLGELVAVARALTPVEPLGEDAADP